MAEQPKRRPRWWLSTLLGFAILFSLGVVVFWGDLVSTALDPKVPFQTYEPPPAPDYTPFCQCIRKIQITVWREYQIRHILQPTDE